MKRLRSVPVLSVRKIAGIVAAFLPLATVADRTRIETPKPAGQVKVAALPGEQIYLRWCAECHASATGPGTQTLERKYQGGVTAILDKRTGIPAGLVEYTVRHGVGFMPSFRKTEISDSELALLAKYLSSVGRDSAATKQAGRTQW